MYYTVSVVQSGIANCVHPPMTLNNSQFTLFCKIYDARTKPAAVYLIHNHNECGISLKTSEQAFKLYQI